MDKDTKAVIKKYEEAMAAYDAEMKVYRKQRKSIAKMELIKVSLHIEEPDQTDIYTKVVSSKSCRELINAIEKKHVRVPDKPFKPTLTVSSGPNFGESPF